MKAAEKEAALVKAAEKEAVRGGYCCEGEAALVKAAEKEAAIVKAAEEEAARMKAGAGAVCLAEAVCSGTGDREPRQRV